MKKRDLHIPVIVLALILSLGILAACQDDESEVTTDHSPVLEVSGEYETQETADAYGADCDDIHLEEPDEQSICEIDPDAPHPFATALMEYMASHDDYEIYAYLVTLDDDGTIGMLITRPKAHFVFAYDIEEYVYVPSETLFYLQDDELFQIDISFNGHQFVAGRHNRLVSRFNTHTHILEIIWKLENGRLEESTSLQYFSDDYISMIFDGQRYVRLEDDDAIAERIAERDALAEYAREKYGLVALPPPDFGHMQNTEDQTAQILAMTIDCEQSLKTG